MNVTLSAEEMLCLCFPNGVQGAEESAVKPWDISSLKVNLSHNSAIIRSDNVKDMTAED